jgi:ATP-dependent 26S proteasome regulatory subunit
MPSYRTPAPSLIPNTRDMKDTLNPRLTKGLLNQYPLIYLQSREEQRLERQLAELSRAHYGDDRPVVVWSAALGLHGDPAQADPLEVIQTIRRWNQECFFLLQDLPALFAGNPILVRALRDLYRDLAGKNRFVFMSHPGLLLPDELKGQLWLVDLGMPGETEILEYLKEIVSSTGNSAKVDEVWYQQCATAMKGLMLDEIRHLVQGWSNENRFAIDHVLPDIYADKTAALQKEGCLQFIAKSIQVDEVGGLENLKEWVMSRKSLFSRGSFQTGVPMPAGILFMGISGCGKSMAAKVIASAWNLPLVRLDMNLVMSRAFGSPEYAFDSALRTAENIAPLVLWIDEMENSFGYDSMSGTTGGSSSIFSSFLTWMQEKPPKVFVVATANRIEKLPAEVIRKGRFDQLFFLDLPSDEERRAIFRIHIRAYGADPDTFNMNLLSIVTKDWSGAEIEQAVKAARIHAYQEGRVFDEKDITYTSARMVPLSRTMEEQIKHLRQWSQTRATPASKKAA